MNPELMRLLWLQVSVQRLALPPAVVLGVTLLLHQSNMTSSLVQTFAMLGFVALAGFWGVVEAANSVLDEARDRTWEVQRMSALAPWTMTWGKLLGATLIPWYAGGLCLGVYVTHDAGIGEVSALAFAVFAALCALLAQAVALISALLTIHLGRQPRSRVSMLLVLFLLCLLTPELAGLTLPSFAALGEMSTQLHWYARAYQGFNFNSALVMALAAWAVFGAYRMMCLELEVRTRAWAWFGWVCFLALLVEGFNNAPLDLYAVRRLSSIAAAIACAVSYIAGFGFARDPIQYRRVLQALSERRYRRAIEEMPLWISSALFALGFSLLACVCGSDPAVDNARLDNLGVVSLALTLIMIRDLSLLTAISFQQRDRRAEMVTLVYLALLNRVLPGLFVLAGMTQLSALIKPHYFDQPTAAVIVASIHALIALIIARAAYRRAMRTPAPSPGND